MADLQKLLCAELKRQLETKGPQTVRMPAGGDLLWRWFCDLNRTRSYHAAGPNPISYAEMVGYAHLMRWPLEPHHVAIIRAMDETFLECSRQKPDQAPDGVKILPPRSQHAITAGMFDAMFGGR